MRKPSNSCLLRAGGAIDAALFLCRRIYWESRRKSQGSQALLALVRRDSAPACN